MSREPVTGRAAQMPLPLDRGFAPRFDSVDFLPAPCNAEALAWIRRWPDWPGPALALYGPAASGKSHLAAIWQARTGAVPLSAATLEGRLPADVLGDADAALLDPADGPLPEIALFHVYNHLTARGGHLLVVAREPPARRRFALADLASRLRAAPAAGIGAPDDTLIAAVLVKHFADRRVPVAPEALAFLLPRMERSFAAAERIAAAADRIALSRRREVTLPVAREALALLTAAENAVPDAKAGTTDATREGGSDGPGYRRA